jgi:hypothetical protein
MDVGMGIVLLLVTVAALVGGWRLAPVAKRWALAGLGTVLLVFFATLVALGFLFSVGIDNSMSKPVDPWILVGMYGSAAAALVLFVGGIVLLQHGRRYRAEHTA